MRERHRLNYVTCEVLGSVEQQPLRFIFESEDSYGVERSLSADL